MKKDYYKLSVNEMLSVVAGDNLPEVVVASSYSRVYGMNYNTWYWANFGFLQSFQIGGTHNGEVQNIIEGEGGTTGGGGGGSSTSTSLQNDLQNLATALGLAGASFELTIASVEAFISDPVNRELFKRVGNSLGVIGLLTGGYDLLLDLESKNWDPNNFTAENWVDILAVILGVATLVSGGAIFTFVASSLAFGWSIYKAN